MLKITEDINRANEIKTALKENGGYCPCSIEQNDDTKCMCKEFRDQLKDESFYGMCHCGLYEKVRHDE